ncbi:hypothetical protein D917_07198 [Trichinella nativa]|uniref:Uncharacterized protein n=1 Tax=Trichinella nativa TaxID=6335 RepID=A0A1Y3ETK0_9BILA|nr:hypothetical protein D917_07198 [Trichinella nativa]
MNISLISAGEVLCRVSRVTTIEASINASEDNQGQWFKRDRGVGSDNAPFFSFTTGRLQKEYRHSLAMLKRIKPPFELCRSELLISEAYKSRFTDQNILQFGKIDFLNSSSFIQFDHDHYYYYLLIRIYVLLPVFAIALTTALPLVEHLLSRFVQNWDSFHDGMQIRSLRSSAAKRCCLLRQLIRHSAITAVNDANH